MRQYRVAKDCYHRCDIIVRLVLAGSAGVHDSSDTGCKLYFFRPDALRGLIMPIGHHTRRTANLARFRSGLYRPIFLLLVAITRCWKIMMRLSAAITILISQQHGCRPTQFFFLSFYECPRMIHRWLQHSYSISYRAAVALRSILLPLLLSPPKHRASVTMNGNRKVHLSTLQEERRRQTCLGQTPYGGDD